MIAIFRVYLLVLLLEFVGNVWGITPYLSAHDADDDDDQVIREPSHHIGAAQSVLSSSGAEDFFESSSLELDEEGDVIARQEKRDRAEVISSTSTLLSDELDEDLWIEQDGRTGQHEARGSRRKVTSTSTFLSSEQTIRETGHQQESSEGATWQEAWHQQELGRADATRFRNSTSAVSPSSRFHSLVRKQQQEQPGVWALAR